MAKRNSTTKTVAVEQLPLGKVVRYNRENSDFDFYFDRQYLGSRTTEHDARECLNEYVYDLERSGAMYTATQLDAGSSVEEIAADVESAPIAPAVTVQPFICDDTLNADYGQPIGTSYLCNGVEVYVPDNPAQPVQLELPTLVNGQLATTSMCITPSALDYEPHLTLDALATVSVLLNSLPVQAAITRKLAGAPPAPMPSLPTVTTNTWQGETGTSYTDFSVGSELTGVMVGTLADGKDGIDLVIGGRDINPHLDEVLTLDDVRQLRDNLTALLNDPRLVAAVEGEPQPPTPAAPVFPIPTVPATTKNGSWQAQIGELDGLPVTGYYAGRELMHATVVYQGVPVSIYAADSGEYVNAGIGEGLGFGGDMHFAEWRALAALGRTDIVDRLLTLFRQYATAQGGTDCEECGARLLPDDEDQLCVRCHGARWQSLRAVLRAA